MILNISSSFIILFESGNMVYKHTNKRHTDRQIDSISERKKEMQYKVYNKTH